MPQQNVLVVGSGGREHALAWKLARDGARVTVAPGNAGIARDHAVVPLPAGNDALLALAREVGVDLVVIGPEAPLQDGAVDALTAAGIPAFGPSRAAARLEGSKAFMKDVCTKAMVTTAPYGVFTDVDAATRFIEGRPDRVVVKADGLCAGKGVVVAQDAAHAIATVRDFIGADGAPRFGDASRTVVIEDFLPGRELSVLGLTDGDDALLLAPARDHKTLLDGGQGPNTGGMGAFCPLGDHEGISRTLLDRVRRTIFVPVLEELARRGARYRGVLYAGLMIDGDEVRVLEFNVRFGDPEAQAVLFGTEAPLLPLLASIARGERLPDDAPDLVDACQPTATIVLASAGYPESPIVDRAITVDAPPTTEDAKIFFAGVKARPDGTLVSSGGRVLNATARGPTLGLAIARAYQLMDTVRLEGGHFRKDIGASAL